MASHSTQTSPEPAYQAIFGGFNFNGFPFYGFHFDRIISPDKMLTVLLMIGVLLVFASIMRLKHRTYRPRQPRAKDRAVDPAPIMPFRRVERQDGSDHLTLVAGSGFQVVPLLNRSEARILPLIDRITAEIGQGHRVMAQVSLGEVLRATNRFGKPDFESPANRAINAKRLDFVIVDRRGLMVAAIEFQGGGHHLGDTAFIRDAVKREALRKAGLHLIELSPDTDDRVLRAKLLECTDLPVSPDREPDRGIERFLDPGE
ncbi:MAG TPA: DUF2726 domain-containing protein [Paenirhodobacter sp.]